MKLIRGKREVITVSDYPLIHFESDQDWEQWLEENAGNAQGVWVKMARKGSGVPSINYQEALRTALCFGWIDGQSKRIDEVFFMQKFTPRRPRSMWSKRNRELVAELIAAGRMRPAGLAQVELAKQDGRWDAAYDSPANAKVPEDLQAALDASPAARDFFATLNSTNRYAVLHRVMTARRPETRQRRIAQIIEMLSEGKKFY